MDNFYKKSFKTFLKIGAFTLGGGYAMIPIIEAEVVERHKWLSREEFADIIAVAQSCPGALAINMSVFIGYRLRRLPGAVCTCLATALPSFLIILLIALFFHRFQDVPWVAAMFRGIRPAVVALICSAGLSFIFLALWNTETLPKDFTKIDLIGVIVLPISLWFIRHKMSVIKLVCMSGVLGLFLGVIGIR